MKVAVLGAGTWGFTLATVLAEKEDTEVFLWSRNSALLDSLKKEKTHPNLSQKTKKTKAYLTDSLEEALLDCSFIIEAVTSKGVHPVFQEIKEKNLLPRDIPIILTSKGIEQNTGNIMPDVLLSLFGKELQNRLVMLSGPSFAEELSQGLPTSIVAGGFVLETAEQVAKLCSCHYFRVYPNDDIRSVAYGGALKNIIAIACGISDGLELGYGAKAALMTRGLHEMVKFTKMANCQNIQTLYGLSGMGDLFLTCSSQYSRNYRFGLLLSSGISVEDAKKKIGMVVEGAYTAISVMQECRKHALSMPISEAVFNIIEEHISPKEAVELLMTRKIKRESL